MPVYVTPTGQRMAYDRDGSSGFWYVTAVSSLTAMPSGGADIRQMNSETDTVVPSVHSSSIFVGDIGTMYAGVIFPENRDLTEVAVVFQNGGPFPTNVSIEGSHNTTTGLDGAWTSLGAVTNFSNPTSPNYRSTNLQAITGSAYKAYRVAAFGTLVHDPLPLENFHLYGQPSTGQNPNSLRIWQPVTNAELTTVEDEGDVPQGTTNTIQFRVHNQSAGGTATGITVSMEALTDATPSLLAQASLSTDNITYTASISIPNLAPGATSAICYLKDATSAGAATGPWAYRIVAVPATGP